MPDTDLPETKGRAKAEKARDLPDRRLSPVLNPLLANQLGRWAEIYYTTPAEKRDEAVGQLLLKLEAEAQSDEIPPAPTPTPANLPPQRETADETENLLVPEKVESIEASIAENLQSATPTEVSHDIDFRDPPLGMQQASSAEAHSAPHLASEWQESPLPWPGRLSAIGASSHGEEPVRTNVSVPDLHATEEDTTKEIDVPDLKGENPLDGLLAAAEPAVAASVTPAQESEASERPERVNAPTEAMHHPTDFSLFHFPHSTVPVASDKRWVSRGLAAAALLLVGSGLLIWTLHRESPAPASPTATRSDAAGAQPRPAQLSPNTATPQTKIPKAADAPKSTPPQPPQTAERRTTPSSTAYQAEKPAAERSVIERSAVQRPVEKSVVEKSVPEKSAPDSTDPDLQAGLGYLRGDASRRDSAEAARFLWKSVRRQNGQALVELAGLYAKGDGVDKDCDQARILLQAAVRHKIPNLEAALETLHKSGCE